MKKQAEQIACQVETMLMGVEIRPDSMTLPSGVVIHIQYSDGYPIKYVISNNNETVAVNARSLKCE